MAEPRCWECGIESKCPECRLQDALVRLKVLEEEKAHLNQCLLDARIRYQRAEERLGVAHIALTGKGDKRG